MKRLLSIFLLAQVAFSTDYYVKNGGGGSVPTTDAGAWGSLSSITGLNPGDIVYLAKGSVFHETLSPASSGTNGNPITFTTKNGFGSGSNPIIDQTTTYYAGEFSYYGSNVYTKSVSAFPARIKINGVEYGHYTSTLVNSSWPWYWQSGTLYVYAPSGISSVENGRNTSGSAVSVSGRSYITLQNLILRGGERTLYVGGGSNYLVVDNCDIGDMSGNFPVWIEHSTYGEIKNSRIDRKDYIEYTWQPDMAGYTSGGEDCISLRMSSSHWDIHDNFIAGAGHDAVAIGADPAFSPGQSGDCDGNLIHDNEMRGGNDYSRAVNLHGSYPAINTRVYNNYCHDFTEQWQLSGIDNWLYYNLIDTVRISLDNGEEHWYQSAGMSGSDATCQNIRIFNNTIRNVQGAGIRIMYSWTNPYVENNIIYDTGLNDGGAYPAGNVLAGNFYHVGIEVEATWSGSWLVRADGTIRNNIIYGSSLDSNRAVLWGGASNQGAPVAPKISPSALNAYNGSGRTISGNRYINPLLASNMTLAGNSPAINSGIDLSSLSVTSDYFGVSVPTGGVWDVGASEFETQGQVPVAPTLTSPADNASPSTITPILTWTTPPGAATAYHVQLSVSDNFTPLADDQTITQTSYTTSGLSQITKYYWRVQAQNTYGWGSYATARSFTTPDTTVSYPGTVTVGSSGRVYGNPSTDVMVIPLSISGTNRYLAVTDAFWSSNGFGVIDSMKLIVSGQHLTTVDYNGAGNGGRAEFWGLVAPTVNNDSVYIYTNGAVNDMDAAATVFQGVNQSSPVQAYWDNAQLDSLPTVDVASSPGCLVVDALYSWQNTYTPATGQTQIVTAHPGGIYTDINASTKPATGTTTTMSWRLSTPRLWSIVGVSLNAAVPVDPQIVVGSNTLAPFASTRLNRHSGSTSFSLSGNYLTDSLIVTAPTNFQVSKTGSPWSSRLAYAQSSGNVSGTVYVRYSPVTHGATTGNVTCSSTGAQSQLTWCSGTTVRKIILIR